MTSYLLASTSSVLVVFSFAACGGRDLDPGAGDDPGGGTSTLTVEGSVSAQARVTNARTPGDYDTALSVRVGLGGQTVTTGTVTMTSAGGKIALTFNPEGGGRWEATAAGYDEVYILDVVSGTDQVSGVRVDGPDIHVFDAPTAGAAVDSTIALPVTWTCEDTADSAWIRAEQVDWLSIPDSGGYSLAAGALKAERDKAKTNNIRLKRSNRVTPRGAAGGSELSVSIENEVEVLAMANPAL